MTDAEQSEELDHDLHINPSLPNSVSAHGEFQFDSVNPPDTSAKGGRGKNGAGHGAPDRAAKREEAKRRAAEKKAAKERKKQGLPPLEKEVVDETEGVPFALRDIHLEIPRGALVCVVGRVGTGKTALLSGLINEMKQIEGRVEFGGKVGYGQSREESVREGRLIGCSAATGVGAVWHDSRQYHLWDGSGQRGHAEGERGD